MTTCKFERGWADRCKKPAEEGEDFCIEHLKVKCCVCGKQAIRECSYLGQFVCGAPLCADCEGWEDLSKPSGNWGFLNHSHRRRKRSETIRD
jgi:hypothetical protein